MSKYTERLKILDAKKQQADIRKTILTLAGENEVKIDMYVFSDEKIPNSLMSQYSRMLMHKVKRYTQVEPKIQKDMLLSEICQYCYDRKLRYSALIDRHNKRPHIIEYMVNSPSRIKDN
jgi:hypothetical protein